MHTKNIDFLVDSKNARSIIDCTIARWVGKPGTSDVRMWYLFSTITDPAAIHTTPVPVY